MKKYNEVFTIGLFRILQISWKYRKRELELCRIKIATLVHVSLPHNTECRSIYRQSWGSVFYLLWHESDKNLQSLSFESSHFTNQKRDSPQRYISGLQDPISTSPSPQFFPEETFIGNHFFFTRQNMARRSILSTYAWRGVTTTLLLLPSESTFLPLRDWFPSSLRK